MTQTHAALDRAYYHAARWLDGLDTRAVNATTTLEQLRARLGVPLEERGADPVRIVDDLAAATEGGLLGSPGGREDQAWPAGACAPAAASSSARRWSCWR